MKFNVNVPNDWIKIEENKYAQLGLVNDEDIKCISAFMVNDNDSLGVVSFYDYSQYDINFVKELDKRLQEINETNALIDGKEGEEGFEDTSPLINIYHGFTDKYGGLVYININKIPVGDGYGYMFQIFSETKNGLVCAQCTAKNIDQNDALSSAKEVPHIKETIKTIFKLK